MRRLIAAILTTIAVTLVGGCSSQTGDVTPTMLTAKAVAGLPCTDVPSVQELVAGANNAPVTSGRHRSLSDWIPSDRTVAQVQSDLKVRESACESETTTSPSSTPATSATTSSSASPTLTTSTPALASYKNWSQVVADPPAGLKEAIDANSTSIGFNWSDVERWSTQTRDARVIAVFGPKTATASDVRKAVDAPEEVPVVHVTACQAVTPGGCPTSGVVVILAEVDTQGRRDLNEQGGVLVMNGQFRLVTDLAGSQIK